MEGLPITKIKEVSELIVREGELISFNNLTTGPVNVGSYSSCSGSVEDDSVVFNFLGCLRGFSAGGITNTALFVEWFSEKLEVGRVFPENSSEFRLTSRCVVSVGLFTDSSLCGCSTILDDKG